MNDKLFHTVFARMKREKLSALERTRLREQLGSRIYNDKPAYSEFAWMRFSFYFSHISRRVVYVAFASFIFIIGGGISYAAESSLPGSLLYSLKVSVTEPLREKLAFSAASQAHLEVQLAERRLSEVSSLASEGRLDAKVKDSLFNEAARHVTKFKEKLAEADEGIAPESAADLSSHLEASLDAHVELAEEAEQSKKGGESISLAGGLTPSSASSSLDTLRNSAEEVSQVRINAEKKISARRTEALKKKSENKFKQVSKEYEHTRALLQTRATNLLATTTANLQEDLNVAQSTLEGGQADLETQSYRDTLPKLLKAGRAVQEAQIMLDATPDNDNLISDHEESSYSDNTERDNSFNLDIRTHD